LALLLVDAVRRATSERSRPRHWVAVAACTALLPYVHLTSLGLVAGVALAALGRSWSRAGSARGLAAPLAAFSTAALACALMYLPALEMLLEYLRKIEGQAEVELLGWLDVPTLLAGGRTAGAVLLAAVPLSMAAMIARERANGVLLSAAMAGPLVSVLVVQPPGMAYAWARYLHVALPLMLLLVACLAVAAARGFGAPSRARDVLAVAASVAAVLAVHWTGPRSPRLAPNGPYDNTYLSMRRLPAFDEPFPDTPEFYRQIAADPGVARIVEAPPLGSRSILLYRNYYLQHRKETLFALVTPSNETLVNGPYVRLWDKELEQSSGADYLVVHMNPAAETATYWNWVYYHAGHQDPADLSFMMRHFVYLDPPGPLNPDMFRPLNRRFGRPVFQDDFIRVWKLR
jgi:hypothetical protein